MVDGLQKFLPFLIEIDRLKRVERQSQLIGGGRRENSAEHSWHLALFTLTLGDPSSLDVFKIVKMVLIHDLVEIDAGDTPLHTNGVSRQEQASAEAAAAERIFGLLPQPVSRECLDLWIEFELGESAEARFAKAMDRLQPLISNLRNAGGTWTENGVSEDMVFERYGLPISAAVPDLWLEIRELVQKHFRQQAGPFA